MEWIRIHAQVVMGDLAPRSQKLYYKKVKTL